MRVVLRRLSTSGAPVSTGAGVVKPPPIKLRAAHFAACLSDPVEAQRAFERFDKNGDGLVERPEMIDVVTTMFRDFHSLKRALRGHHSVSTAMQFLPLDCVFWVVLAYSRPLGVQRSSRPGLRTIGYSTRVCIFRHWK